VNDELSLFGEEPAPEAPVAPVAAPITGWQVDLLRKALDARGLTTMSERQSAIEVAAGRPVESLRALTHDEGLQVLSRLGQAPTSGRAGKSAWDDRDEDTWIDRL
jgi:DNA polymerase-3 subunit epsilon